jgi:agmatinase
VTAGAFAAHRSIIGRVGVIQFDAHADLRETYNGSPWNHACTMARIRELVPTEDVLQLGIRSMSRNEAELIRRRDYAVMAARTMRETPGHVAARVRRLPKQVYITVDVDVFDPSVVRATGTPEPGGLTWFEVTDFLREIFHSRQVVGIDITETGSGDAASAFTIARLLYRMIGWWSQAEGQPRPAPRGVEG